MKKIVSMMGVIFLAVVMLSLSACSETKIEPKEELDKSETTEESETSIVEAPALSGMELELLGVWGELKRDGHVIRVKEDGTLSVYENEGEFPNVGDYVHTRDGFWRVEGDEVCISIDGRNLYYSFTDEYHNELIDRDGLNYYARVEDDATIPE